MQETKILLYQTFPARLTGYTFTFEKMTIDNQCDRGLTPQKAWQGMMLDTNRMAARLHGKSRNCCGRSRVYWLGKRSKTVTPPPQKKIYILISDLDIIREPAISLFLCFNIN